MSFILFAESERFLERTFKLRPQKPPTAVQVYGIDPSTVRVTWRYVAPTVKEEPLTGYKVKSLRAMNALM